MRRVAAPLLIVALAACGGGDDADPTPADPARADVAGGDPAPDGAAPDDAAPDDPVAVGGSAQPVRIYGTTPAPARDGFVLVDSDCTDTFDSSNPGFPLVDVQLPPEWNVVGYGGGIRFESGGAETNLAVSVSEHPDGTDAAAVLAGMFPGETNEIGSVTWGTRTYPVAFDGSTYGFAALAGEIDNIMGQNLDFVFSARFGGTGTGDVTTFGDDTILAVFESMSLNACAFDEYVALLVDPQVTVVD